jgi:predicted phage terminase large subunit-like protein
MKSSTIEIRKKVMRLRREKLKLEAPTSFSRFLGYSNPKYELEWFHKDIADHCQMLLEGKIKNLMVFMPPQHGKSEIISRNFPAFAFGQNPDLKIVGSSYSADLAEQFSRAIQRTIDSREYHEIFPDTYLNGTDGRYVKNCIRNVDFFELVGHRGFYKAVGVGGALTGTPVDIAIIDDPVKDANEANSATYRQRVWDWYNTVLTTRLHNHSKQLFIMTRWHEDDLAGRILKAEPNEWVVLSIPALCEQERDGGKSNRHIGDALWPSHHSKEKLEKQKARAPREFSALYQQHPTIEGGNIVKRHWFKKISLADFRSLRFNEPMHFYLDTAYNKKKQGQDNDPSGILAACRIRNYIYIYNAMKVWKEMPDLLRFLPDYMSANEASSESKLHVEPKANGESVIQMLKEISTLNVKETETLKDSKEVRLRAVSPRIECGRVFLVDGDWNDEFLDEVCGFPTQPHDEFVDILGYAINDLYLDEDNEIDYDNLSKSVFGI